MNAIPPELYQLLLKSFDVELQPHEAQQLQAALQEYEELRTQQQQVLQMRTLLAGQEYQFTSGFEDRVMDAITRAAAPKSIEVNFGDALFIAFRRVALSGVAAILLLLAITYFNQQSLSLTAITGINTLNTEDVDLFYTVDM